MTSDPGLLRDRNLRAFRRRYPDIAKTLAGIKVTVSVIERDGAGAAQNLMIADTPLYPAPAVEWTAGQMRGFLANPLRILFPDASHTNLSPISLENYKAMVDFAAGKKILVSNAPVVESGYMFVYGIGLGHHLGDLMTKVDARNVVLIEPVVEFLVHSLSVVDWSAIFRLAKKHDKEIHFVLGMESAPAVRAIEKVIYMNGNDFLEGSYFYFHYYSWAFKDIHEQFSVQVKAHFNSMGFFEDEVKMVTNASENARRYEFRVIEDTRFSVEQPLSVFVVGSGPSLDADLPYIRKWRDRVVLFSCGTSLGILLKHGLKPDIHTEVENGELTWTILSKLSETYDLSGITLAASLTVDPRVPALFDRHWFFFRGALSSTRILKGRHRPLTACEPTVANTACAVATNLGFGDIYLFGVDCGYADTGDQHHSKDSVYYGDDKPYDDEMLKKRHSRLVPGNFGGTFRTTSVFNDSMRALGGLARATKINLYNCSHGARIDDAIPKAAVAITLPASHIDRHVLLGRLDGTLPHYEPEALLEPVDVDALVTGAETYRDGFRNMVEDARACKDGFWRFSKRVAKFNEEMIPLSTGFLYMARGTIRSCVRAPAYIGNRIENKRQRRAFLDHFYEILPGTVDQMCDISADLFRKQLSVERPKENETGNGGL